MGYRAEKDAWVTDTVVPSGIHHNIHPSIQLLGERFDNRRA
jgi:hypothetical protein